MSNNNNNNNNYDKYQGREKPGHTADSKGIVNNIIIILTYNLLQLHFIIDIIIMSCIKTKRGNRTNFPIRKVSI